MNATTLYVNTCKYVLQAKSNDPSSSSDLTKQLSRLRQSLSCSVCGNLLRSPHTPSDSSCEHHVCGTCRGGRKRLRPSCSWCKDYSNYHENEHLKTLLQCYRKLCEFVTVSEALRNVTTVTKQSGKCPEIIEIIKEGTDFYDESPRRENNEKLEPCRTDLPENDLPNGESSIYSVIRTNNNGRLTFKRAAKEKENDTDKTNGNTSKEKAPRKKRSFDKPLLETKENKVRKRSVFTKPPTCDCGHVSKLKGSCRGYRCPCYSADKSCLDCECISCKNPRGPSLNKPPSEDIELKVKEETNSKTNLDSN